jgi:uncharacterized protein
MKSNEPTAADIARLGMAHKTFDVTFKADDADTGSFTLYCACFGNVDLGGDVIEPGAFKNLESFVTDGFGLVNHVSSSLPVAWVDSAVQDSVGLKVAGRFHTTPEAQACRTVVLERMAAGKAVKCSLGYVTLAESFSKEDGATVRHIEELDVYEFSFVGVPMNPLAAVQSAKSLPIAEPESEQMKRDAQVLATIKRALGLAVKGAYEIDGEDMEKVKGLVDKCATCTKSLDDAHKSMKGLIDTHKSTTDELVKCLKNFQSGQEQGAAEDDDGPVADDPKEPVKDDDEDTKTAKAYRDQLKRRASSGRRSQLCP